MNSEKKYENQYYVISSQYELIDFNISVGEAHPQILRGQLCYNALHHRETPCINCPIQRKDLDSGYTFFDPSTKEFYESVFARLTDNQYAVICRKANSSPMHLFERLKSDSFHLSGEFLDGMEHEKIGMLGCYCDNHEYELYYVNKEMLDMLGYESREEMTAAIDNSILNMIHPDDKPDVLSDVFRPYNPGNKYETTYRMPRKDGSWVWTLNRGEVVETTSGRPAFVAVVVDLTDHMKSLNHMTITNTVLKERNNFWSTAFENMPGAYYRAGASKGYPLTYISNRFLEMTGWTREEIKDNFDDMLCNMIADELAEKAWNFDPSMMIGTGNHESNRILLYKTKTGLRWVNSSLTFVDAGEESFLHGTLSDIHDQVNSMEDVRAAAAANNATVAVGDPLTIGARYGNPVKGKRVLIVDESDYIRIRIANMLEQIGADTVFEDNGIHCVQAMKQNEERPFDLVILSMSMPWMSGYDTAGMIREAEDERISTVPIILTYSNKYEYDEAIAAEMGIKGAVAKDCELTELLDVLQNCGL